MLMLPEGARWSLAPFSRVGFLMGPPQKRTHDLLGNEFSCSSVFLELAWLLGMTVIGLLLLIPAKGMTRMGGAAMIVLYLLFVVNHLLWPTI